MWWEISRLIVSVELRCFVPMSPCGSARDDNKGEPFTVISKKRHKKGTVKNVNHFLQSLMILVEMRGVEPLSKKPVP